MGRMRKSCQVLSGLTGTILAVLAGCTVGPDYQPPQIEAPPQWSLPAEERVSLKAWWKTFDDPLLWQLIERADAGSLDLRAATARIEQAMAFRRYTAGGDAPMVNGVADYARSRASENGTFAFPGVSTGESELYAAGFNASWEIDLFGRVRRSVEYAQRLLEASIEDYRGAQVSLYAETARNYVELRTIQQQIQYAMENIAIQKQTLELAQNRFKAQLVPELDVLQAKQNLAVTEAEIPSLRIAEKAAINRLAVLLGMWPSELNGELSMPGPIPELTTGPGALVPAELLRQRPDIRSAERALAAQTARIGMATAQLYPAFSLTGYFELQATDFADLGDWGSRAYSYGPGLSWNLLNGGRIRRMIDIEEAATREALAGYEATVLRAAEEVENALTGYVQDTARTAALERSVEAAKQSVEMSQTLYRSGLADFEAVLISQQSLFRQQDRLAVSRGQILQRAIAIYRALGGGWDSIDAPNQSPAENESANEDQQPQS